MRQAKVKKDKKSKQDKQENLDKIPTVVSVHARDFVLPHSITTSEVSFPVLITKGSKVSWKRIVHESERFKEELQELTEPIAPVLCDSIFQRNETVFLVKEVFGQLIPAIDETLRKAQIWNSFVSQECFFNGIDHIAQYLWNNNPRYSIRKKDDLHIFNMPWVRKALELNPRDYYPKSWLWPKDHAATVIQKYIRGHFVRCDPAVAEMRLFWKKLAFEKQYPALSTNPMYFNKLALSDDI